MTSSTPTGRRRWAAATVLAVALLLPGCASGGVAGSSAEGGSTGSPSQTASSSGPATSSTTPSSPGPSSPGPSSGPTPADPPDTAGPPGPRSTDGTLREAAYGLGSRRPDWLFSRVLPRAANGFGVRRPAPPVLRRRAFTLPDRVPMLPGRGYGSRIVSPAPDSVIARSTWAPGCPVSRDRLAWLRMTFRGFDGARHTGELLVHADHVRGLDRVFRRLWQVWFPLEQVMILRDYDPDAPPTGDGNSSGAFVCRPITGGSSYSQHATGLALDLNAFQNPYLSGDVLVPELAGAYLDRSAVRPGMITPDGPVVRAFAGIGWEWGGYWSSAKDYMHFSANGR